MNYRYIFLIICFGFAQQISAQPYKDYLGAGHNGGITITSSSHVGTSSPSKTMDGSGMNDEIMAASRFIAQATLGGGPKEINEVLKEGYSTWIDSQFTKKPTLMLPQMINIWSQIQAADPEAYGPYALHFNYAWWQNNMTNEDLLRQRMAYSLSQILVTSINSDLEAWGEALCSYYDIFVNGAFGNYKDVLLEVAKHPAMGYYLSHLNNPALQGNNNFAGAIDIQNDNQTITNNKIFASIGSLQNYLVGLNLKKKMKKVHISLGGDLTYNKNVFSYLYNGVTDKRTPTNLFKQNFLFDFVWFTSKNQVLKANLWFQHANRHIPVSVSSAPTDQRQTDQNLRTQISHLYYFRNKKLETSISYMNEKLNFFTPAIRSLSTVNSVIYTSQLSETKSQKWFTGVTFRRDAASPNFYTSVKTRNTLLLSGAYKMNWSKNLTTNLSLRQDHVDKKWMPLSWNVHTAYRNTTLTISGNYNLPGFNDLYWPVGGNINLKTEKSTQAELKTEINSDNWVFRLATYAHVVHDWIQWLPQSNGLFSPENQKKVFSRGLDFSLTKKVPFNNFIFEPIIQCNLNKTTAIDHYFDPTLIGKQLIYVPKLKAKITLNAKFKNQQALLSYDFTGTRYDVPDQSMQLRPIHLLHLSYQINRNNWNYILQFNNVLDLPYQVTRFYPMPGINLSLKVIHNIL